MPFKFVTRYIPLKISHIERKAQSDLYMNLDSHSPELRAANKKLRRTLKPLLQFIPSQRFINWLTHKRAPAKGPNYEAATSTSMKLGQIECLRVTPNVLKENTSGEQNVCILYFHGGA